MSELLFELPLRSAERSPNAPALSLKEQRLDYASVAGSLERFAAASASSSA